MTVIVDADILVLGAGIAGVSLAGQLSASLNLVVLEVEGQAGRHATGRSAATFFETYGNGTIKALTRASRGAFVTPEAGFAEVPLVRERGALHIARADQLGQLEVLAGDPDVALAAERLTGAEAQRLVSILRTDYCEAAVLDRSGMDVDVDALVQGYIRKAKRSGARFVFDLPVDHTISFDAGRWQVRAGDSVYRAPVVVNATGAWADQTAAKAGVRQIGLRPLRRSACTVPIDASIGASRWPLVIDIEERFYFKPDAGALMVTSANETPSLPTDAAPEELEIAIAIDRFQTATTLDIRTVIARWAGLRSFVADRTPVVGFAPDADGFFWLAAQGGYGVQTAPAIADLAAALVQGKPVPDYLLAEGVEVARLSPDRPGIQPLATGELEALVEAEL